jgi:hypothetical protein
VLKPVAKLFLDCAHEIAKSKADVRDLASHEQVNFGAAA